MRGHLAPTYRQDLENLARRLGVVDKITFLPFAAPGEMVRLAVDYDVGLAIEPGITPNNQLALSNKIFVYLLAGLPVLLSQTPAQKSFASELGPAARLVDLNDPVDTAKRLDEFAVNSEARAEARTAAWRLGRERFNWDLEKFRFLELIENHIGPASTRAQ
jgi:glycosyltransferase involved in cell wall biosynthesis